MTTIEVKLVISNRSGNDSVPASLSASGYNPDLLEKLVNDCLRQALLNLKLDTLESLKALKPEISIHVSGIFGSTTRPSLHLAASTLDRLATAGASLDFDPY